jgi:hypothetical protein
MSAGRHPGYTGCVIKWLCVGPLQWEGLSANKKATKAPPYGVWPSWLDFFIILPAPESFRRLLPFYPVAPVCFMSNFSHPPRAHFHNMLIVVWGWNERRFVPFFSAANVFEPPA